MRGHHNAKPVTVNGTEYPSTGSAIRSLHGEGWTRAEIAKATGAPIYFVSATLTDAVRSWPIEKKRRMKDILMRSLATIADMTGVHEEYLITFAMETLRMEQRDRIRASSTPAPAPPPEPAPVAAEPAPMPVAVVEHEVVAEPLRNRGEVENLELKPPLKQAVRTHPAPRTTAPRAGEDPAKLFNLRDPATGEWLHQTIVDEDGRTLTTLGKTYRYEQTPATINRLRAKLSQFASWEMVPIKVLV